MSSLLKEKLQKKITIDFLISKIRGSFKQADGVSGIDKDSAMLLLEYCGYKKIFKRDLCLYTGKDESSKEVIVLDGGFSRYHADIEDVAMRKSPSIREMLSFKNAKKILSDSDVLKSSKEETLDYLRSGFIKSLGIVFDAVKVMDIAQRGKIELEALAFENFSKTILILSELQNLKYLPALSRKYKVYIFARKVKKENKLFLSDIHILDSIKQTFFLIKKDIKEEELKKMLNSPGNPAFSVKNEEALDYIKKEVDGMKNYNPFESNLFYYGVSDKIFFNF